MTAITGFNTYAAAAGTGGSSNREDLMDLITNITPTETPMFSGFAKTPISATYHEWLTDSLASASKENAAIEGADFSYSVASPRTRVGNYTQIFTKTVEVTRSQRRQSQLGGTAGVDDEFDYQLDLRMKEIARDIEDAIVNGTANAGASGTAREMKGILSFIATNIETGTGTGNEALTETMYNNLLQTIFTAGGNPDVTYVNGWQKRKIDSFATPNTRYQDGSDGKLSAYVAVYQSSFGVQKVVLDRYMSTTQLAALEQGKWKLAIFDPIHYESTAKVGDADRGAVVGELTLVSLQEAASGKITGLSVS